ncbi:c-type cytochrome biogenesis protein CcmI [Glaciecola sp. KUL10]|uniref:c-type cytochrome biogenesis protein CcmI n=1 Tax=Glaciecola sp. (strain KUL10) TaxID=2161813 RepID=UPI000D78ACF6|nr:c-type cytochrome biogenesis protein CcmI [Glaciecola sp. KUL10]GBL04197.1 cytochrome c-type biogenesis protein [Glaciecola sp. KUL10]
MSIFYIISALLFLFGLVFVFYPWLKRSSVQRVEVNNVNVIRARIEEIKKEAEEGLINQDEMQQSIDEMKLALVDETQNQSNKSTHSAIKPLIIGAIPTLIIGIWVYVDANQLSGLSQLQFAINNTQELNNRIVLQPANDVSPQEFQKYALVIRQQLRKKPDDAIGWTWLGRINMTLGQMEESVNAFKKALTLKPQDDELRSRYAQAAMMRGDEEGLAIAFNQLEYLIRKAPQERQYRLLMTVVAAQSNNAEVAFSNFALIKDQLDPSSSLFQSLSTQLRSMGAPESLFDSQASDAGIQPENNNNVNNEPKTTKLEVMVSVAESIQAKLPSEGFLIVFAQDASGQTRLPLAVKRVTLPEFPFVLSLSEEDAMLENFSLKTAEQVKLTARISMDEDVMPSSGELQGELELLQMSAKPNIVEIIIDKELP